MSHSEAVHHLRRCDRLLRAEIDRIGDCGLRARGGRFSLIAGAILSQQISVAAARTIRRNLESRLPGRRLSANGLLELSETDFQISGVSRQKRDYLCHLAQQVVDGRLKFRRLVRLPDEEVIDHLTKVKGVGRWTAQMFLIFGLGRPDVFAPDDLGLRNAMVRIYSLSNPTHDDLNAVADRWSPHRSVASWYLWRYLDSQPNGT
ncbi:MAG: DNA-3-methyladenine glycosylase [Fuerstiella sp.]|nr:DNA-3-methyladenine glycosylase [Fuerstiella sp.]